MRANLAFVLLAGALLVSGAEPVAEEYHVKGAFLLNFPKFVDWPDDAFKGPRDPIAICVLGANPFTAQLEAAAKQVVVGNRGVTFHEIADVQQAHQCQIVFVALSEKKRARALLDAVQKESVLTVSEYEGFIAGGGLIEFRLEEGRVRMEISAAAAKRSGLHINAKLLSLSQSARR